MSKKQGEDHWHVSFSIPKPRTIWRFLRKQLRGKVNSANKKEIVKDFVSSSKTTLISSLTTAISLILMLQYRDFIKTLLVLVFPSGGDVANSFIMTVLVTLFAVSALYVLGKRR